MLLTLQILLVLVSIPMLFVGFATSLSKATQSPVFKRVFRPGMLLAPLIAIVAIVLSFFLSLAELRYWALVVAALPLLFWAICAAWLQHKTRFFIAKRHVRRPRRPAPVSSDQGADGDG